MGKKTIAKHVFIILIPLLLGLAVSFIGLAVQLFINLIWVFALAFIAFWFWAGQKTFDDYENKAAGFAIENSVWLLCLLIFIWQTYLTGEETHISALASLAMSYVVFMIPIPSLFYISYEVITGNAAANLTLISFGLMLLVFTGGFLSRRYMTKKKRKKVTVSKPQKDSSQSISEVEKRIETLYGGDGGRKE
ncbi:MAG: hypothetical protein ACOYJD_06820 [Christensenellales bacterium]|jgi:uncharacterized membrane protein YcgQ (UPF0703/DUF1980 family)